MRKRVLFIDHDSAMSGSSVSLAYLVRFFHGEGFVADVITPKPLQMRNVLITAGAECDSSLFMGRNVLRLPLHFIDASPTFSLHGASFILKELAKFICGIWVVGKAILKYRPHLVYTNEFVSIQACIAARLLNTPSVVHIRGPFVEGTFGLRRRLLSYAIAQCSDLAIAITEYESRQIIRYVGDSVNIHVVGEFLDRENFSRSHCTDAEKTTWGIPTANKSVITLGGIFSIKGTLDFLHVAGLVLEEYPDVSFVVAGPEYQAPGDPYTVACKETASSGRLKGHVAFLGHIQNPLGLIRCCDVLVSPNTKTHFSRPIIEAWACGKPVVATDTAHTRLLVEDGVDGFVVATGDHRAMAGAVLRVLRDSTLARSLGESGCVKARRDFGSEVNARRIYDLCCDVMAQK